MNTVQGGTGGYSNSGKKGNIDLWEVRILCNDRSRSEGSNRKRSGKTSDGNNSNCNVSS